MILSEKFSFIFIKGKRVGGTSVEMALSTICGARDIVTPIAPIDELERMRGGGRARNYAVEPEHEEAYIQQIRTAPRHALGQVVVPKERYYNHMPLQEVIAEYGPSASSMEIICVERSPFAKILSWANWLASSEAYLSGGKLRPTSKLCDALLHESLTPVIFPEVRNIELYRGEDGRVAAHALRHENLAADLHRFLTSRGVSVPTLPRAKAGLSSDRLDPRAFFSTEQLRKIDEVFGEEFDTFGYTRLL